MSELFTLVGKVALVTGGTRGIGFAIAQALGLAGARVVISSESAEDCTRAVDLLERQGISVNAIAADLRGQVEVDGLARRVLDLHGGIDVLICNAGVAPHIGPISSATSDDWDLTMTVNLRSALWLTSAVLPSMAERGGGSVVLMASIAAIRGNKGLGLYALSKAGLAQLARNLAVEWGPSNIRVNAISPGLIQTDFARPLTEQPQVLERRLALTPLRRIGQPEEVAGLALLLASPAGGFITGQNIVVDGGTTIGDGN